MENFDDILLFKTNLEACDIDMLKKLLGTQAAIITWNIDLEDADRVLRIISETLSHQYIIQLITGYGYQCCELT